MPPCREEIPELNKLSVKYKDDPNVIFVAFALDEDSEVEDFVKKMPFGYTLSTNGRAYAAEYNINLYPTNVVIDKAGKVRLHYVSDPINGVYWLDRTIQESKKGI
ncbi:TlpA family protein disulfide reductase [Mucilaginibacter sp. UR6-11]|nr:TlpA family protein disulfide reductase [Mucilaginibacter sp. UR6-11]